MKRKPKKKYLKIDQIIYRPWGWSEKAFDNFIDKYLELVESFSGQVGGGFSKLTDKEVDEDLNSK